MQKLQKFAIEEVAKIGILKPEEVRDSCVFRVPTTYPAYFGTYDRFDEIVHYMERFENLRFCQYQGRNGMHISTTTRITPCLQQWLQWTNIVKGVKSKYGHATSGRLIPSRNKYHEQKSTQEAAGEVQEHAEPPGQERVA